MDGVPLTFKDRSPVLGTNYLELSRLPPERDGGPNGGNKEGRVRTAVCRGAIVYSVLVFPGNGDSLTVLGLQPRFGDELHKI